MISRFWPKLVAASLTIAFCVAVIAAWRADRRDRAQLAAELAATKQLLVAADARQRDRDAQLAQTLSALDAQKRFIVTPAQIVRELPKSLSLPEPITLQSGQASPFEPPTSSPPQERATAKSSAPDGAVIPRADLKPLYDFTLDCQACQAKLSAAQNDFADEKTKTAALTKERDDALRLAKGGTAWRRITRAAKWFLLGAAAGAVISKAR